MNNPYFGAHYQSDDLIKSAKKVKTVGGNLIQIFVYQPSMKINLTTSRSKPQLDKFKLYLKENNMKSIVHASYTHNLARDWDKHSPQLKVLEAEIKTAAYLNAVGIVIHFGKQLDLSKEEAYNNMYTSLVHLHNQTLNDKVTILLETPTGQGTETCYKIEELAHFYKKFKRHTMLKERFRICIDTCHIFSAGYDLKTPTDAKLYLEAFDELIGLKYVSLIHLNDCKVQCGFRKDRHQNIGKGFIGMPGLQYFFNFFYKLSVPIILETPSNGFKIEIPLLLLNNKQ